MAPARRPPAALGAWRNSGAVAPGQSPSLGWNGARLQYEVPGYIGAVNLANLGDIPAPADTSGIYNGYLSPAIYGRARGLAFGRYPVGRHPRAEMLCSPIQDEHRSDRHH